MGNWLVTILALILLLAVLDGVRRAVLRQRASMKVSRHLSREMHRGTYDDNDELMSPVRNVQGATSKVETAPDKVCEPDHPVADVEEYLDPEEEAKRRQIAEELPGSVRVVQRRALEEALQVNRQVQESFMSSRKPLAGSQPQRDEPEQTSLNLDDQVPTLMDSVVAEEDRREPELNESESLEALSAGESGLVQEEPAAPVPESDIAPRAPERAQDRAHDDNGARADTRGREKKGAAVNKQASKPREKSPVEEVLIINVMAPEGDFFEGNDILRAMMAARLRFGEMNIFHYHQGGSDDGPVVFSLANMVVPGVFDLAQMEEFTSPGLSLFLALPIEGSALAALEQLLATSRQIAEQLGGELKDENRSVFTAQTAEHYRQRVMEYQRRRALARAQA
ncbi:cell division protein ZipA [Microbulbifer sp. SAOS-129_SWC]|uniref:cell division protein ZipA n=1 Tax=Microbulbifer sp. SAOS-129_SWC TaxID=3145235 RepID=UPI003216E742